MLNSSVKNLCSTVTTVYIYSTSIKVLMHEDLSPFNVNCSNIITEDCRDLLWCDSLRYLGVYINSARTHTYARDYKMLCCRRWLFKNWIRMTENGQFMVRWMSVWRSPTQDSNNVFLLFHCVCERLVSSYPVCRSLLGGFTRCESSIESNLPK